MNLKKMITPSLLALGLAAGLTACSPKETVKSVAQVEHIKPELGAFGIATDLMDTSVKPGDNFFMYVNGGWMKTVEIPADKSNYGSFTALHDRSVKQVKAIIEDASTTKSKKGSAEQKIGDLYAAFMDMEAIEAAGMNAD